MKLNEFSKSLGLGASLAIGFIVSTAIISKTFYDIKSANQTIKVKGYSERRVQSEKAMWSGIISVRSQNLIESHKKLKDGLDLVRKTFSSIGINDIKIESPKIIEYYKKSISSEGREIITNEIDYYVLNQNITFSSHDIKKVEQVSLKMEEIWEVQGEHDFSMESLGVRYYYPSDKLETLKLELIKEATINGKIRAEQFASSTGAQVSKLTSAKQGVFQVVAENSTDTWDTYDTRAFEKIVKCVADLSFLIK